MQKISRKQNHTTFLYYVRVAFRCPLAKKIKEIGVGDVLPLLSTVPPISRSSLTVTKLKLTKPIFTKYKSIFLPL